jgi:outer membrane receptor protein involved in Fe transport
VGNFSTPTHGLRLNHALYGQQVLQLGRLSLIGGARFIHNETFGNKVVPRVAATFVAYRGGPIFSGTRLRFSYATGIKEPRFDESFSSQFVVANPNLKAERNRAVEAGVEQNLLGGRYSFSAIYFNNLFQDQIDFSCCDTSGTGQYVNVDKSLAHGAEVEFSGHLSSHARVDAAYSYTSTQILAAPFCTPANFCDPLLATGQPLLRRPRHSATTQLTYLGGRWGGNVGGSFVGRRADSDFLGFGFNHASGYVRVDVGGWYLVHSRITVYANIENALDKRYNEVVGYPALPVNFRAGLRFRIGGE